MARERGRAAAEIGGGQTGMAKGESSRGCRMVAAMVMTTASDGETRVEGIGQGGREEGAPQARKLGKSQGRGCAWCAGQAEGASSGSSCALPLGRAIGGAFLPANTCPGERVLAPERRE